MHIKNLSAPERLLDQKTEGLNFYCYGDGDRIKDLSEIEKPLATFINAAPISLDVDSVCIEMEDYTREIIADKKKFTSRDYVVAMLPKNGNGPIRKYNFYFEKAKAVECLFTKSYKDREEIAMQISGTGRFYLRLYYKENASIDLTRPKYIRKN